jgi:arylsulfatase
LDHDIRVDIDRPGTVRDGVLVAQGSAAAGYVLYLKDGRLYYETSLLPRGELIDGGPVPAGKVQVRFEQVMTKRPLEGRGALYVGKEKRAEHVFARVLVTPSYDGFSVGSDPGGQVSKAYQGPNPFAGQIARVQIDVKVRAPTAAEAISFMKQQRLGG